MHDGSGRIVVQGLTKQFGPITAVQDLSFVVEPGAVTGFIGPNGAGKTTTLRMMLGLITPNAGSATFNGQPYERLGNPARVVGAVLEEQGFHPKRTARNHLRVYATAIGVPDQQAEQVLALVGLTEAGNRRVGGFSMGMRQRLSLATALLGDPQILVLDEPANGLDPEGIAWLRNFLRSFAATGRSVLVSSHLLAELEQTADQFVIISRGQCVFYGSVDTLRQSQDSRVLVDPSDPHRLVEALRENGFESIDALPDGRLAVLGAHSAQVADIALAAGVAVRGMAEESVDLERLFLQLTSGEYAGNSPFPGDPAAAPRESPRNGPPPGVSGPAGSAPSATESAAPHGIARPAAAEPAPPATPEPDPAADPDEAWRRPQSGEDDEHHRGLGGHT